MPEVGFLQDILILLGLALASAFVFSRLRLSPIIGYLLAGTLVGPYGFHLISDVHQVEVLAELGVILLLFTIGLEFSFNRILRLRGLMFKCGSAQVLFSALVVFAAARLLGLTWQTGAILAMALPLSSTAIVLKLLLERGEMDSAHGRLSLAILLFQDLCVVLFLVALPLLGGRMSGVSAANVLQALAFLGVLFLFVRYLLRPVLRMVLQARSPELFRLTILLLVLGTAWASAQAGLSLALGAFLAGLALAESDYSHQALSDILPFRDTFLALFFISIGMLVDLRQLAERWDLVLLLFAVLSLVKILTGSLAALLSRYPLRPALLAGFMLFQVGEFSFLFLKQAMTFELMPPAVYQSVLAVIALSMLATPLLIPRAPALAAGLARRLGRPGGTWEPETREKTANLEGHVIVAGYGLSGRNVGRILREMGIPHVFVELNGESVMRGKQAGEFIVYGDATMPAVLEELGIERARALVLAINDPSALSRAIRTGRHLNPEIYILARTRFVAELEHLTALGADEVLPDELEASLQLSAYLLRRFHIAEGRIMQILGKLREEHYERLPIAGPNPAGATGYFSVLGGGEVQFQPVPKDSPCLGKSLGELAFRTRTGAMVAGVIRREQTLYSPPAELRLEKGDTLMLLGDETDLKRVRDLLTRG